MYSHRSWFYLGVLLSALIVHLPTAVLAGPRKEPVTQQNRANFLKSRQNLGNEALMCRIPNPNKKKVTLGFVRKQGRKKFFYPLSASELQNAKSRGLDKICAQVVQKKCRVTAANVSINAANEINAITDFGISACERPLRLVRQTRPSHGVLTEGLTPTYQLTNLFTGTDTAKFKVTNGLATSKNTATLTVTVAEFGGSMSLTPYREKLTAREVRTLLRKVAFGGTEELFNIGVTQGRTALVNALLNDTTSAEAMQRAVAAGQSLRRFPAPQVDACGNSDVWYSDATQRYWHSLLLHGNPLVENIAVHLHDHFATDTSKIEVTSGCASVIFPRDYLELIRDSAMSSFSGLITGMLTDGAMSRWLDNVSNHYLGEGDPNNYNQNFAREFLELFTMGKYDHYNVGVKNYDERDVIELTHAFSGHCLSRVRSHNYSRDPVTLRYYPNNAGPHGGAAVFMCDDLRDPTSKQFLGSGPDDFTLFTATDYVIAHPKTAENIAHSLFSRFVAVAPPKESIVGPLASQLSENSFEFDLKDFFRTILNSSAMFSSNAVRNCIDSPVEHLTYISRIMKFPGTSTNFLQAFATGLAYAGHSLLQAPNVFSWQMCGDDSDGRVGNRGQAWLQHGWIIQRFNAINSIIAASNQYESYDPRSLFTDPASLTPDMAIDKFEELFNLELSDAERARVRQYLDRTTSRWDASNAALTRARLGGLYYLFATHVKVITK